MTGKHTGRLRGTRLLAAVALPASGALLLTACGDTPPPPPAPPRAVSYVTLQRTTPPAAQTLSASIESWKREDLGFRVAGRVEHVVDPGTDIVGATVDERGRPITEGTVIATLDDERYRIVLAEAEAAQRAAEAQLAAAETELDRRIPEMLKEARADQTRQQQNLERYTQMVSQGAAGQERLDAIVAAAAAADARVAQVEAARDAQTSAVEAARAQVQRAREAVELAKVNLRDCRLVSPFTGQVARVHTLPGGYVLPGQPTATVQMMDPIRVLVAVSSRIDEQVTYNDRLRVRVKGIDEPLVGVVYLKDTFADPATRTFLITLLVRNRLIEVDVDAELLARGLPETERIWRLQETVPDGNGPWGVEVGALQQDDEGWFVWKAENVSYEDLFHGGIDPLIRVRKVRVEPGEERMAVLRLYTFRMLDDIGELDPERDAVVGNLTGVPEDGGEVLLRRRRWMLRPGDLAEVELTGRGVAPGLYVPERAIRSDGTTHHVCVAIPTEGSRHEVRIVEVRVGESTRGLQRVEPVREGALADGARVIVDGAQYVVAGEQVALTSEVRQQP